MAANVFHWQVSSLCRRFNTCPLSAVSCKLALLQSSPCPEHVPAQSDGIHGPDGQGSPAAGRGPEAARRGRPGHRHARNHRGHDPVRHWPSSVWVRHLHEPNAPLLLLVLLMLLSLPHTCPKQTAASRSTPRPPTPVQGGSAHTGGGKGPTVARGGGQKQARARSCKIHLCPHTELQVDHGRPIVPLPAAAHPPVGTQAS